MRFDNFNSGIRRFASDARHYQIVFLLTFTAIGVTFFDFEIRGVHAVAMVGTALVTQFVFTQMLCLPHFDPRSPLISALSLCLLLRTDSPGIAVGAAAFAIASKFLVRWRGKHIFNPTNIAIVTLALLTPSAWISSGQWGSAIWVAFLLAGLGGIVTYRASRSDIAIAVLLFHAALLFGRAFWLGDPLAIPIHQMQNGALLVFAFFMISDPKTTPDARPGRIVYALLVVAFGGWVQFGLFRPNGLLYGLAALAPIVPFLDWLMVGRRFEWTMNAGHPARQPKGVRHEPVLSSGSGMPMPDAAH